MVVHIPEQGLLTATGCSGLFQRTPFVCVRRGGGHERRLKAKFVQISVGGVNMGGSVTSYSGVMLSC